MGGIGRALDELCTVFKHFKKYYNHCSAAFVDLRKAFDSVSFEAIYVALQKLSVSQLIDYIRFVYFNANTYVFLNGRLSGTAAPRCSSKRPSLVHLIPFSP